MEELNTPEIRWKELKKYIIEQIEKIDNEVEEYPNESTWLLEMEFFSNCLKKT